MFPKNQEPFNVIGSDVAGDNSTNVREEAKKGHKSSQRSRTACDLRRSEEVTENAGRRPPGAVSLDPHPSARQRVPYVPAHARLPGFSA